MISTCIKASCVGIVLLAIAWHTPAALDHAIDAAQRGTPLTGYQLAEEYSRQIFAPSERNE